PECGLHVSQAEVEPELGVQKTASCLKPEIAQASGALGQLIVVDQEHAALAGGEQLVGIETEAARRAEAADAPPTILGAVGFGGVLDDLQLVALGEVEQ